MRMLLLLVVVAALGGGLWFLFGMGPAEDPGEETALVDEDGSTRDPVGAVLSGEARRPDMQANTSTPAPTGDGKITVTVEDAAGTPVSGVTVHCYFLRSLQQAAFGLGDPGPAARWAAQTRTARPVTPDRQTHVATATTDATGRVSFEGLGNGSYRVSADIEAPRVVGTTSPWLTDFQRHVNATLHVYEGSPLTVRVRESDGETPTRAWVQLRARLEVRKGVQGNWHQWVEVEGEASLPAVPAGEIHATAYANEQAHRGYKTSTPTEEPLTIVLRGGDAGLRGRIVDEQEQPIRGAEVIARCVTDAEDATPGGLSTTRMTRTDADGLYRFDDLPAGALVHLGAHADGYAIYWKQWQGEARPQLSSGDSHEHDITLVRTGSISGTVTLRGRGPVEGAKVLVMRHNPGSAAHSGMQAARTVTTDAQGRYRVEGLRLGTYAVIPEHMSGWYAPVAAARNAPQISMGSNAIPKAVLVIVAPEERDLVRDLELLTGIRVEGRVVDNDGKPVPDAVVAARDIGIAQAFQRWMATSSQTMTRGAIATTDAEGRFSSEAVPFGTGIQLYAQKEGMVGKLSKPFDLAEGGSAPSELDLLLEAGATLRGRVVDADGKPLAGVHVQRWGGEQTTITAFHNAQSKEDGTWILTGVSAGDHYVSAFSPTGRMHFKQLEVKGVTAGEERDDLELRANATNIVSGILRRSDGKPAAGVNLRLISSGTNYWGNAATDSQGRFRFMDAPTGKLTLAVQSPTGTPGMRFPGTIEAPAEDLEFTYDPPAKYTVRIRVLDPEGKPVPRCTAQLGNRVSAINHWARRGTNIENGEGEVTGQGEFPLTLRIDGARDSADRSLGLAVHEQRITSVPKEVLEIRLQPGKRLAGFVRDPSGGGIAGVQVMLGNRRTMTDEKGGFAFTDLGSVPRHTLLQVMPGGDWIRPAPTPLPADGKEIIITLRKGQTISGSVVDDSGALEERIFVQGEWKRSGTTAAGSVSAQTQADGSFVLHGIPENVAVTVKLNLWGSGAGNYAPTQIEAVQPGTANLVIRLRAGMTIRGVVVEADGTPASAGRVLARGKHHTRTAEIQSDGRFELKGLASEEYALTARRNSGGPETERVSVEAGRDGVKLQFAEVGTIRIEVTNAGTEAFTGYLHAEDGDPRNRLRVRTQGEKTLVLSDVPKGRVYRLQAAGKTRYLSAGRIEARKEPYRIEAQSGQAIRGELEWGALETEFAVILVRSDTWEDYAVVRKTGDRDTFATNSLPPGTYSLELQIGREKRGTFEGIAAGSEGVVLKPK